MLPPSSLRHLAWLGLLAIAAPAPALAETAAIEKNVLFAAGDHGYAIYRIPAIITTPQKTVLVAAEGRKNGRGDWGLIDIFVRRSTDSGRTWEAAKPLVRQEDLPADVRWNPATTDKEARPPGFTISNATWVADAKSGRTLFLFCVEYERCFVVESPDGGETFSQPREISAVFDAFRTSDQYAWRVIATGPGHGEQLSSGRLIVPVWLSTADGVNAHHPSVNATIYSDDGGVAWSAGAIVSGRTEAVPNPSETAIVEVAPGKVMLAIRHESPRNRKALTWSVGGAGGWSTPELNEALWEPVCMAALTRLPDGRLVFANPASLEKAPGRPDAANKRRQNLALRLSHDQGKTWSGPLVLEPGPSAYSDLAVAPDGTVLCFYESGKRTPYDNLTLARVPATALPTSRP